MVPPLGWIYSCVHAPLTDRFGDTPRGSKVGTSQVVYFLEPILFRGSFAFEEAAIARAAEAGGIETIHYADYRVRQILGLYTSFAVTVYGD